MEKVVISLGSNVADRHQRVMMAMEFVKSRMIREEGKCSDIYETMSISGDGRRYVNAVVSGMTDMCIDELNRVSKNYEIECGRTPEARTMKRVPIDIDVVMYGETILRPGDFAQDYFTTGYREVKKFS